MSFGARTENGNGAGRKRKAIRGRYPRSSVFLCCCTFELPGCSRRRALTRSTGRGGGRGDDRGRGRLCGRAPPGRGRSSLGGATGWPTDWRRRGRLAGLLLLLALLLLLLVLLLLGSFAPGCLLFTEDKSVKDRVRESSE